MVTGNDRNDGIQILFSYFYNPIFWLSQIYCLNTGISSAIEIGKANFTIVSMNCYGLTFKGMCVAESSLVHS